MKKIPYVAAGGGVAIAGLMLSMVSWTSESLEQKADKSEVHQLVHNIDRMDEKLNKILWHLIAMKHTMNGEKIKIATEENGRIP